MTEESFLAFCAEALRVARRWVVFTCDWRFARAAQLSFPKEFVRLGVWVKPDCAPQFSGDRPGMGWEAVLILHRPGRKRWNGGGKRAVWVHNIVKSGTLHRTQKPLPLITTWIEQFTDPGETVVDPYAGSGTTGVACVQTGRNFIGCEINPEYHAIAERRIAEAQNATPLFSPAPPASTPPARVAAVAGSLFPC